MLLQGDPGTGRWRARTGSGDILLHLPASANVRVEAATRRGDIKFDLPQVRVGRPGPVSQRGGRTIGVLGEDPRAEIELETGHGDIGAHLYGAPPAVAGELPGLAADVPLPAPDRPRAETPEVPAEPTVPTPPSTPPPPPAKTESNTTALRILESLAQGEISVQEAESLLRSLEPA